MRSHGLLALSALALLACDDALIGRLRPDAGSPDAGASDAATPDTGTADAGAHDAAPADAASADAAPTDASLTPVCDLTSLSGDAAVNTPVLAYGGASASNDEVLTAPVNNGRQFEVTEDCVVVTDLGVWDHRQDGLSRAHDVTLFSLDMPGAGAKATPILGGQATVAAGSDVPLQDGFRLAKLAAPVQLPRGYYAIVAYDFYTQEPYGGGGTLPAAGGPIRDLGFDPFEVTGDVSPAYPRSSDTAANSSASFRYVIAAP